MVGYINAFCFCGHFFWFLFAKSPSGTFYLQVMPNFLNIYLSCRLQAAGKTKLLKLETRMFLCFK